MSLSTFKEKENKTNSKEYEFSGTKNLYVCFNSDGYVMKARGFTKLMWCTDNYLVGKHVDEVAKMIKEAGIGNAYTDFEINVHLPLLKKILLDINNNNNMESKFDPKANIEWKYYFENICKDGDITVAEMLYCGKPTLYVKEDRTGHYTVPLRINLSTFYVAYEFESEICKVNNNYNDNDSSHEKLKKRLVEGCKLIEENFLEQIS